MRLLVTTPLFFVAGFLLLTSFGIHPTSALTQTSLDATQRQDGLVFNWFWAPPEHITSARLQADNADPQKIRFDIQPTVRLQRADSQTPSDGSDSQLNPVIISAKPIAPPAEGTHRLLIQVNAAEQRALDTEQALQNTQRQDLSAERQLQAKLESEYEETRAQLREQLRDIERQQERTVALRAAEAQAVQARLDSDLRLEHQRLQALRDTLTGQALQSADASLFLKLSENHRQKTAGDSEATAPPTTP